jgi:hypothetical protein
MNIDFKKKCSKCGGEVKKGYIQAANRIAWVPEVTKASVEPSLNKGAVVLSKQNRFSINYVDAYLCKKCEAVFIDYSDNNN